jgi:enoyl-CoA hydratase/carnithine racemase
MMRDRIPRKHHEEVLLGGGLHSVTEAARLGLLDRVSANAEEDARATLKALSSHPSHAYRAMKYDLREHIGATEEQERVFLKEAIPSWTDPEFKAKIHALIKGK